MVSFLIRRSPDQSLLTTPRGNIAVCRVLHRLLIPRHPPYALINLTTIFLFDEFRDLNVINKLLLLIILSSFQRTKSERNDLSKPSKISIQKSFYEKAFHIMCKPRSFHTVCFLRYLNLHRKEVIHPHVLVGIPCYDFTPVTCPTLGAPIPYGFG